MIIKKEYILQMARTYKHTRQFYNKKYLAYKKEVKRIGGIPLNKNTFISAYDSLQTESKTVMKDLVYSSKYGTSYKTALAEYQALKRVGLTETLEGLKTMTTQDFAAAYANELSKAYKDAIAAGATSAGAASLISQQWFGSN